MDYASNGIQIIDMRQYIPSTNQWRFLWLTILWNNWLACYCEVKWWEGITFYMWRLQTRRFPQYHVSGHGRTYVRFFDILCKWCLCCRFSSHVQWQMVLYLHLHAIYEIVHIYSFAWTNLLHATDMEFLFNLNLFTCSRYAQPLQRVRALNIHTRL